MRGPCVWRTTSVRVRRPALPARGKSARGLRRDAWPVRVAHRKRAGSETRAPSAGEIGARFTARCVARACGAPQACGFGDPRSQRGALNAGTIARGAAGRSFGRFAEFAFDTETEVATVRTRFLERRAQKSPPESAPTTPDRGGGFCSCFTEARPKSRQQFFSASLSSSVGRARPW